MTAVTIAGTSHALRLQNAIKMGLLEMPSRGIHNWQAHPATMLASPVFMEADFATQPQDAVLLVPEMRLGNRFINEPDDPTSRTLIDKSIINPDIDAQLYALVLSSLRKIAENNPRCIFIFWSLLGREYEARTQGRYMDSGTYLHPIWNLEEIEQKFPKNVFSLSALLREESTAQLFVDRSNHPSWLGQRFLMRVIENPSLSAATVLAAVQRDYTAPQISFDRPTAITGNSLWVRRLKHHVTQRLIELGSNTELHEAGDALRLSRTHDLLFVSSISPLTEPFMQRSQKLGRILDDAAETSDGITKEHSQSVRLYLWDARAQEVKKPQRRNNFINSRSLSRLFFPYAIQEPTVQPFLKWRDLELSADGAPSIAGLCSVLRTAGARVISPSINV